MDDDLTTSIMLNIEETMDITTALYLQVNKVDNVTTYPRLHDNDSEWELREPVKITVGIAMIAMILISLFGNSVVCLIVFQKPAMRSAINLLLANMAVSDIFTSLTSMTFSFVALFWSDRILGDVQCKLIMLLQEWFGCVGMFMLVTISIDRYLIIIQRKDKLISSHAKMLIFVAWVASFLVAFPPAVGWGHYKYSGSPPQCILGNKDSVADVTFVILRVVITFFFPVFLMTFAFSRILNVVKKNKQRIHNHPNIDFNVSVVNGGGRLGIPMIHRSPRVNIDMSFKTRAFKTILLLFIAFLWCWTPYFMNTLASITLGRYNRTRHLIFLWIGFTNSAINPIIYSIRIKKFRDACRALMPDAIRTTTSFLTLTKRRINPSSAYEFREQSSI